MCASTETDVRESASDCTLASGEGLGSRGETLHPICAASPCPHPLNALYNMPGHGHYPMCYGYLQEIQTHLKLFQCQNHFQN
jgi:hypothetical protein